MIGEKLPGQHHEDDDDDDDDDDDEILVVLSKSSRSPLIGVRGKVDWVHTVENLQPSAGYRIRLHLRAMVSQPILNALCTLECTLHP